MPVSVNGRDPVGHDRGRAAPQGAEQVAVGHQAQPLVPRVVRRVEVRVDVDTRPAAASRSAARISLAHAVGQRRLSWYSAVVISTFFQRTIG